MANRSEESVELTWSPCIVSTGPYTESMNLVVTKLHYDLVVGEKWLHEHRATISCHTNTVEFWHRGKAYRKHTAQDGITKEISVNAITKDLKLG